MRSSIQSGGKGKDKGKETFMTMDKRTKVPHLCYSSWAPKWAIKLIKEAREKNS